MGEFPEFDSDPPRQLSQIMSEARTRFSELEKTFDRKAIVKAIGRLTNTNPTVVEEILFKEGNRYPNAQGRVLQCAQNIAAKDIVLEPKPVQPPGTFVKTTWKRGRSQPVKTSSSAYKGTFLRIAEIRLSNKDAKIPKPQQKPDYLPPPPASPRRKKREPKALPGSEVPLRKIDGISSEKFMTELTLEERFILAKIFLINGIAPFRPFRPRLKLALLKNWTTMRITALFTRCLSFNILKRITINRKIYYYFLPSDLLSPENSGVFEDLSDKKNLFLLKLFGDFNSQSFVYSPESGPDFEELLDKGYIVKVSTTPSENKYVISRKALDKLEKALS